MTNDELIANIAERIWPDEDTCKNCCALIAVVELHKPKYMGCGEDNCCGPDMCECGDTLPCPTIVAIEEHVK